MNVIIKIHVGTTDDDYEQHTKHVTKLLCQLLSIPFITLGVICALHGVGVI